MRGPPVLAKYTHKLQNKYLSMVSRQVQQVCVSYPFEICMYIYMHSVTYIHYARWFTLMFDVDKKSDQTILLTGFLMGNLETL